jgi:hypothetical protein
MSLLSKYQGQTFPLKLGLVVQGLARRVEWRTKIHFLFHTSYITLDHHKASSGCLARTAVKTELGNKFIKRLQRTRTSFLRNDYSDSDRKDATHSAQV